ncbi:MAG: hypothetical protein K6G76_11620 [Lachnospiraceae bacterium]|nr:hypothetical protein [Lachnospiraceae bacterium]
MNDKKLSKFVCRIINLIIYIITLFVIIMMGYFRIQEELEINNYLQDSWLRILIILAAILIGFMIIALICKYNVSDDKRLFVYRIMDTIVRLLCTVPITIIGYYYLLIHLQFEDLINTLIGIVGFVIINLIIRLALQESMNTTYILHDEL